MNRGECRSRGAGQVIGRKRPAGKDVPVVNFHRMPFVALAAVVLVIAGSLTYFWRAYKEPLPPEYGWGAADTLQLGLALERSEISINDTLNFTATLTNTGPEKVRIYPYGWSPDILVYREFGHQLLVYVKRLPVPAPPAPRPSDPEFNRMLVVLEPNGTYSRQGCINNDTFAGWYFILPGGNYSVEGSFACDEKRGHPALPVWTGRIQSPAEHFSVLP